MNRACNVLRGRFGRVTFLDLDRSLVSHAHPHCHLIFKVAGTDQEFVVEGTPMPLRCDTVVAVNVWQHHGYFHRPNSRRMLVLVFYIDPEWLAETDRMFHGCARPHFFPRACVSIGPEIQRLRMRLVEQMAEGPIEEPDKLQELILELCLRVSYGFCDCSQGCSPVSTPHDFRIGRALRFMREHAIGPVDLDGVARVSGLSRPHFNHLFRACTGLSPRLYLNALRIEAAVGRLHPQQSDIGAISEELGFSAQSNFTRFFRQHTGASPHQYRRVLDDLG